MIIEKLSHLPEKSKNAIIEFSTRLEETFPENLESIILFGSAAGGNFMQDKSDINILIILQNIRTIDLNAIMDIGRKFAKKGLGVPLVFETDHIATSLDTFPIEFSDMKQRHILLYGKDPLENASIEGKNLRYQCERELKAMMVNLRRGFLKTEGRKERLEELLTGSLSSVLASCRGMIWLQDKIPPDSVDALLSDIRTAYNTATDAINHVWHLRKGQPESTATLEMLFEKYVDDVEKLSRIVDNL